MIRVKLAAAWSLCQERGCRIACGIRDWAALTESSIPIEEADIVSVHVGGETLDFSSEDFRAGLEVELEHGLAFTEANVTNNHPTLMGRIVLAHLKEMRGYYVSLKVADIDGDMLKAAAGENSEKLAQRYKLWRAAKADLTERERILFSGSKMPKQRSAKKFSPYATRRTPQDPPFGLVAGSRSWRE